jgi:hypothetical protein
VSLRVPPLVIAVLLLVPAAAALATTRGGTTQARYSRAVTGICAHALLFEGRHKIGTRAGALAVARDIRASTRRRLVRVARLRVPAGERPTVARWLPLEQRLANLYARTYVRIFDVIDAATTPAKRAREVQVLRRLIHAPDPLQHAVVRLESRLHVPDCTGGVH